MGMDLAPPLVSELALEETALSGELVLSWSLFILQMISVGKLEKEVCLLAMLLESLPYTPT